MLAITIGFYVQPVPSHESHLAWMRHLSKRVYTVPSRIFFKKSASPQKVCIFGKFKKKKKNFSAFPTQLAKDVNHLWEEQSGGQWSKDTDAVIFPSPALAHIRESTSKPMTSRPGCPEPKPQTQAIPGPIQPLSRISSLVDKDQEDSRIPDTRHALCQQRSSPC